MMNIRLKISIFETSVSSFGLHAARLGVLSYEIWLADSNYNLRLAGKLVVLEILIKKLRSIVLCSNKFFFH